MSNKLDQMKKRLLLNRPQASISDEKVENQLKLFYIMQKTVPRTTQIQPILAEQPQQIIDKNVEILEQNNSSSPSRQVKGQDNLQFFGSDKPAQSKKQPEILEECAHQDLQRVEIKRFQQALKKKNEDQACNLQLVDKNPFFSCSVDEEVKGSCSNVNEENEKPITFIPIESKQHKKQHKIILKELELVKKAIRNLKSSVKGLQKLQLIITSDPKIKTKVKLLLQQMSFSLSFQK